MLVSAIQQSESDLYVHICTYSPSFWIFLRFLGSPFPISMGLLEISFSFLQIISMMKDAILVFGHPCKCLIP